MKALPALALALVGCATSGEPPLHGAGHCKAEAAVSLVGQPGTAELAAKALKLSGARVVRWIRPGSAVTMDYNPGRLDIDLDENGKVSRFRCG